MPYLYSLFYEASQNGMPVQRSLAIDYTHDPKIYNPQFHHQYLFGPSLLVIPVESTKDITKVYLPEGNWYSLYDGKLYPGSQEILLECPLHRLPVFVKEGAIIPMQEPGLNTQSSSDTLDLHLYYSENKSTFVLYWDDGQTFDYKKGYFSTWNIKLSCSENKLSVIKASQQSVNEGIQKIQVVFHGFPELHQVTVNGNSHRVVQAVNRFFEPLEKYDPINEPEPAPEEPVQSVMFENPANDFILSW